MANKLRWCDCATGLVILAGASVSSLAVAAEFIIGPTGDRSSSARESASSMRDKARVQRDSGAPAVPLSTIVKELEDPDSPFSGRPPAAATDNRNRARAYQQGGDSSSSMIITPGGNQAAPVDLDRLLVDPDSNRGRMKSNLDRARAYQRGDSPGVTNARMGGTEDLPLVDCGATQNSAGRIGNDSASGQVIVIMKGDRGVKVRCR